MHQKFAKYQVENFFYNVGFLMSHLVFPGSYRFYIFQKKIYNWVMRRESHIPDEVDFSHIAFCIEGFRHSGNTFLATNILSPKREQILTHHHRYWVINRSLKEKKMTFVLIRNAAEVVRSTAFRAKVDQYGVGVRPYRITMHICWILYYASVLRKIDKIHILDFKEIKNDYGGVRLSISEKSGAVLREVPDFSFSNRFDGPKFEFRSGIIIRILERISDGLYVRIIDRAQNLKSRIPVRLFPGPAAEG